MKTSIICKLAIRHSILSVAVFASCLLIVGSVGASPLDILIPEPTIVPSPTDFGTSSLLGFSWNQQFELDFISSDGSLSDRVFVYNAGAGGSNPGDATVVFLSDDESGHIALIPAGFQPPANLPVFPFTEGVPISIPGLALVNNGSNLPLATTNQFFSDDEINGVPTGPISDFAKFTFVTPEPGTLSLAGLGLISLAALAYRRRRILKLIAIPLLLIAMTFGSAEKASAQLPGTPNAAAQPYLLDFDETGASLLNGGPNPNGINLNVPGGGIEFYLPGLVTPGDVLISVTFDSNTANLTGDSDLLSFYNGPGLNGIVTGIMLYQSLAEPLDPLLAADVQILRFTSPLAPFPLTENGTELLNDFTWTVPGATYHGLSDGFLPTPEPSTFVLGGLGLLSLAALAYRRRLAKTC